jgi:site-specific recombinase XerD
MWKKGWIIKDEVIEFHTDTVINTGAYKNLMLQVNKIARHAKSVSIPTQRQYYHHMDLFVRHLADYFGVQSLRNIQGKHIASYVEYRQYEGKSADTVKNDLSAIRYYHDQIDNTKYFLPNNEQLQEKYGVSLEKRSFGGVSRRWTDKEYNLMIDLAIRHNRSDIIPLLELAKKQGLRIHEAIRLAKSDIEKALRTNCLTIKGKGGLVREVPLRSDVKVTLETVSKKIPRGQKVFIPEGKKAHQVIQSLQGFITRHREKISDPFFRNPGINLSYHGLRHNFSYDQFWKFRNQGFSEQEARLKVAKLIGHSREDVTRIYLS